MRDAIVKAKEDGDSINEDISNIAGIELSNPIYLIFWSYSLMYSMWAYGRHYQIHALDEQRHNCDLGIACKLQEENDELDYIDLLEEILELDYRNLLIVQSSQVVTFKVQWSYSHVEYDHCLFYAIVKTYMY
jgi:hypothetical protein